MFHVKHTFVDTIAAIASPIGPGGVGVVRISGPRAKTCFSSIFSHSKAKNPVSHRMILGWIENPKTKTSIDQAMACYMRGPRSYTGEDVVELYCHGGAAVLNKVLKLVLLSGARLAKNGEFTKRAFLNGRLDLAQAESVAALVAAKTGEGAGLALKQLQGRLSTIVNDMRGTLINILAEIEAAIDFEDDMPQLNFRKITAKITDSNKEINKLISQSVKTRIYRDGVATVIVGRPNVGKSSLLNALLEEDRAIVTDQPGTTRDAIEETINIKELPLRVIDTAGIRHPKDKAEHFSIKRAEKELAAADLAVVVIDASSRLTSADKKVLSMTHNKTSVIVLNKVDLGIKIKEAMFRRYLSGKPPIIKVSAKTKKGLDKLTAKLYNVAVGLHGKLGDDAILLNARHKECLTRADVLLSRMRDGIKGRRPIELLAVDLKEAVLALGEITGEVVSDEVIDAIFDQFCVGK